SPRALPCFFFYRYAHLPVLHSFPTRRSSDLDVGKPPTFRVAPDRIRFDQHAEVGTKMAEEICRRFRLSNEETEQVCGLVANHMRDRKSTRLNSSHVAISYAVFCLKKKKKLMRGALGSDLRALPAPRHGQVPPGLLRLSFSHGNGCVPCYVARRRSLASTRAHKPVG